MKNKSIKTKILAGLLTGGIYLSSASTTFATTTKLLTINSTIPLTSEYKQINTKIDHNIETIFENPVTPKTITEDQANKIKAVINKTTASKQLNYKKSNLETTIIGQENKTYNNCNKHNNIKSIATLLNDGTITESQAEKIVIKQIYLYQTKKSNNLL
ncbi:MAG TPA: hypothetical protein VIM70_01700 [Clostridium sp.]|uniref:hypothetical protein n=1 Tax=Clostridium sp. TaxID=1506 RepID=UPI002F942F49